MIYVPTDNTIADNAPIIDNICRYKKVPVIGGDEGQQLVIGQGVGFCEPVNEGFHGVSSVKM